VVYPTDEMIRELAYKLWTDAGQPEDREQEFWHQAERQLQVHSLRDIAGPERDPRAS
jgi:hypothetical protein